jgi:RimJ/RimL family protein N-acetyltransferase
VGFFDTPVVRGRLTTLEPLAPEMAPELADAIAEGELYALPYVKLPAPDEMAGEIDSRLARQSAQAMAPWAIRRNSDGRLVGMTGYVNVLPPHRRLTLGATWVALSAHNTGINQESKYLLMERAFEVLDCIAVEFRANAVNERSRRAYLAIGATQDGILRSHELLADGTVKDTVFFSVTAAEWPGVKAALAEKLARKSG